MVINALQKEKNYFDTSKHIRPDPTVKEHSPSKPEDRLTSSPPIALRYRQYPPKKPKTCRKGERDAKNRSRPLLYRKGAGKDHSTAKYI